MPCNLLHIPNRLHWNGQAQIARFWVGDILYRRCTQKLLETPFNEVSLYDISHNLGTNGTEELSQPEDVLLCVLENGVERYSELLPCALVVRSLSDMQQYDKCFSIEKDEDTGAKRTYTARIRLLHAPVLCMYVHCVFSVYLDEVEVTKENYRQTLGQGKLGKLRDILRKELHSMIESRSINQNSPEL